MIKILQLLICLASIIASASSNDNKPRPLYFQADKNGLQILVQKFEYALVDEERVKIGDIMIDANTFNFQLVSSSGESGYAIKFNWPAGLLTTGQLILLNNNRKAIWSTDMREDQTKVTPVPTEFNNVRSELAEFTSAPITAELLTSMKYMPFIKFCIQYTETNTKVYLCSRELFVSVQGEKMLIKARKTKKPSSVEINGKEVGSQGIIFLNDPKENILFRATAESGAYLEIETRMKPVDFKDVIYSDDKQYIFVTASGAAPASKEGVNFLGPDLWSVAVPVDRPVIYLRAEGGIPMRQEFFVRGQVPVEASRPYVASNSKDTTFSSSVTLRGLVPAGGKLSSLDAGDELKLMSKNRFEWTLNNLKSRQINKRYLGLQIQGQKHQVRCDVLRGQAFNLRAALQYQSPSGVAYGLAHFQWWFEKFLGDFTWGVETDLDIHLTKKDGYPEYDEYKLELLYKFNGGFQMSEPTWGLGLPMAMIKGRDFSITTFGLSFWGLRSASDYLPSWVKWYAPKLTYLAGGSGSDFKMKSGVTFENLLYSQLGETGYLTYGLGYRTYTFDPAGSEEKGQIFLDAGYLYIF